MFIDAQSLFCDNQTITADAESTNTIDLGAGAGRNLNPRLRVFCQVTKASTGTATLAVQLQGTNTVTNGAPDFTTPVVLHTSTAVAPTTQGEYLIEGLPLLLGSDCRFLRLYFDATGSFTTAPTVTGGLIEDGVPHNELEH